jgi:hypothetical protein
MSVLSFFRELGSHYEIGKVHKPFEYLLNVHFRPFTPETPLRSQFETWYPGIASGNDVGTKPKERVLLC